MIARTGFLHEGKQLNCSSVNALINQNVIPISLVISSCQVVAREKTGWQLMAAPATKFAVL